MGHWIEHTKYRGAGTVAGVRPPPGLGGFNLSGLRDNGLA